MKFMLLGLLFVSNLCNALALVWNAPTSRENGQFLHPNEICCYDISIRDKTTNKQMLELNVVSTGASKYTYTFALPTNIKKENVKFYLAAVDKNGLYSRFVEAQEYIAVLLPPTDGEID